MHTQIQFIGRPTNKKTHLFLSRKKNNLELICQVDNVVHNGAFHMSSRVRLIQGLLVTLEPFEHGSRNTLKEVAFFTY